MGSDKGLYIGILIILIKYSWHNMVKQNYTLMGGKAWCCFLFLFSKSGEAS